MMPGKRWSPREVATLRKLIESNSPTRVIGMRLGRKQGAIYNKASRLGVSVNPIYQSPYSLHPRK